MGTTSTAVAVALVTHLFFVDFTALARTDIAPYSSLTSMQRASSAVH